MGDDCKKGQGCVFLSKDLGWVPYDAKNTRQAAPKPVNDSWKDSKTTILVSISSFRDSLCPKTLYNLFKKAKYPDRITVSIIQQNVHGEDDDCLDTYCEMMSGEFGGKCPHKSQILIKRFNAHDARGPQWARAEASKVILGRPAGADEFCLQMDSHMDFVHDFDVKMMEMWALTENEYGILSTYVTASENLPLFEGENAKGVNNVHEVPHLCMITLQGSNGMPRNWGTKCARSLPHPKLTNSIWGAGLSFSKCHAERKVPYDPHLPYIFDGEEFSRAVRFFTWGYDIYTPHRVYIVHDYTKSQKDPLHFAWTRNRGKRNTDISNGSSSKLNNMLHPYESVDNDDTLHITDSVRRIERLLGRVPSQRESHLDEEEKARRLVQRSRYGLGDRRTLEQAATFTGVDLKHWHVDNRKNNRCGNLEYVPFHEHPKGAAYEPHYDPITEAFADERDKGSVYRQEEASDGVDKHQGLSNTGKHRHESSMNAPHDASTNPNPKLSSSLLSKVYAASSYLDIRGQSHSLYMNVLGTIGGLVILFIVVAGIYSFARRRSKRVKSARHQRLAKDL